MARGTAFSAGLYWMNEKCFPKFPNKGNLASAQTFLFFARYFNLIPSRFEGRVQSRSHGWSEILFITVI